MDKQHFTVVAGFEAAAVYEKALAEAAAQPGFNLPRWQVQSEPTVAAEIVSTIYGYGVRYASGLNGFAIIASAQSLGTLDKALQFAQEWAADGNARAGKPVYYVFIRNSALADAGKFATLVAEREARAAESARQTAAWEHDKGMHVGNHGYEKRCAACAAAKAVA